MFAPSSNHHSKTNLSRHNRDILLLLSTALAARVVVALFTDNMPTDADCRAFISASWAHRPYFIDSGIWLPLHFYIVGTLSYVFQDAVIAGKLLSVIAGVLTVIPIYNLALRFFGSTAAVISGFLFATFGLHVGLSAVSLSEAPFAALALWAIDIYYANVLVKASLNRGVLLSACLVALAGWLRQEAWILSFILAVDFYLRTRRSLLTLAYLSVALSSLLTWSLLTQLSGNSFIGSIAAVDAIKKSEAPPVPASSTQMALTWLRIFVGSPGPIVIVSALVGMYSAARKRKDLLWPAAVAGCLLGPYFVLSLVATTWAPQARYTVLFTLLLIPYAGAGCDRMFKNRRLVCASAVAAIILTCCWQAAVYYNRHGSPFPIAPRKPEPVEVSRFLSVRLKASDPIFVEDSTSEHYRILLRTRAYRNDHFMMFPSTPEAEARAFISRHKPRWLILHQRESDLFSAAGRRIERVYVVGDYELYRAEYTRD